MLKKIDPYRLTTIAHVTMTPKDGPMHEITDVESYNHYFGWYGGKTEDNGPWMDEYHENIQTAASDCRSMAVRESLPIREEIQSVKITARHIRQDTTNIWLIC